MPKTTYIQAVMQALELLENKERANLAYAAQILTDAIAGGKSIFSFGASHSFIPTEELVYRTGGLMIINPIYPHGMNLAVRPMTLTSKLERVLGLGEQLLAGSSAQSGDVLIIASTSGRNAVAIDMAAAARQQGITVIGLTALAYSTGVTSRHPSGKRMMDYCDVVIDNCAPYGDAAVGIDGFDQKVGPLSTITAVAIVNTLVCQVVENLLKMGIEPPVFMSANLDGGDEYNERLLAKNKDRIHYMD